MGPEIQLSSGAGVWGKAPKAFPDSSFVLDQLQHALSNLLNFQVKKPMNSGIVPEMDGGQNVYVFPFFLGKEGNT